MLAIVLTDEEPKDLHEEIFAKMELAVFCACC